MSLITIAARVAGKRYAQKPLSERADYWPAKAEVIGQQQQAVPTVNDMTYTVVSEENQSPEDEAEATGFTTIMRSDGKKIHGTYHVSGGEGSLRSGGTWDELSNETELDDETAAKVLMIAQDQFYESEAGAGSLPWNDLISQAKKFTDNGQGGGGEQVGQIDKGEAPHGHSIEEAYNQYVDGCEENGTIPVSYEEFEEDRASFMHGGGGPQVGQIQDRESREPDWCSIHDEKKYERSPGKWYCGECEKERNQQRG
jgi:hypothetical protein